jgi:hypothetical protein
VISSNHLPLVLIANAAMPGAVTSIFRRPWHLVCVLWFVMHIPTTILVDGQSG